MRAAYIEQTGPVENIRVGDLPRTDRKTRRVIDQR